MKIGVIGTGNIGEVIIRKIRAANHEVKIANARGPESLQTFANEVGATATDVTDAVDNVDIVILVIPTKNIPDLPEGLFEKVKPGTVVIDTSNYYPFRDGLIDELENGMIESEWVSKHIKYPVVKTMNTMFSHSLIKNDHPAGTSGRLAFAISGDDSEANALAAKLIDSIGYDPVIIGSIANSWRQQGGAPIYCTDLTLEETLFWFPKAIKESLPERRERIVQLYFTWPKDVTLEQQIKDVRTIGQGGLS